MARETYLLGVDVGTTGSKSVIFDLDGRLVSRGYKEYPMIMPKHTWAEQNPNDWWKATVESTKMAIRKASIASDKIAGLGLSGQLDSPSFLDKDGIPIRPSILWIDLRTEPQVAWVCEEIGEETVYRTTGVKVNSFYSFVKIMWIKENEPETYERTKVILQPKDYVGFKLTDEYFIDKALASSSGFLDIKLGKFATDLLGEMGIPTEKLPRLVQSTDVVGNVTRKAAEATGLKEGTPVVAGSGDVMANAVGSGVLKSGLA
ncbi:MAG: FGGY family carbohydrate kinase, partial [Candidatus Bathyarchaeota archaeon]|nr:FGGY family carbohydrate kinase [Candidatus Bathyarchaeota archaeon]